MSPGSLGRLAVVHAQQGRLETAVRLMRDALDLNPGAAELHNNFGLMLHAMQRTEQAIASYRKALVIRPRYAVALNNLGAALAALERHAEAAVSYQDALTITPAYAEALCNLGTSLHVLGRYDEATERFREALALRPGFVEAWTNLGHALAARGRLDEAIPCYEAALEAMPGNFGVHVNLARALNDTRCHAKAIEHYRKAIAISPGLATAHSGLGVALLEIGRIDDARNCFERAAFLEPACPAHLLGITRTSKLTPEDPHLGTVLALEKRLAPLGKEAKIDAHFALAKALADIGEHRRSFDHLLVANGLKRESISYNERKTLLQMERVRAVFTAEFVRLRQRTYYGSSLLPVFIVGMPRSGSTLIEQVLASHPRVFGAGEVDLFCQSLRATGLNTRARKFPDTVPSWSEEELSAAAQEYLRRLEEKARRSPGRLSIERITDKMLSNFRYLGLIHLMLPNACIIHTCRDPIDTCLSCFSIEFARIPFAFDLGELGRHYQAYDQLMRHWRAVLRDRMLEVRYEDTVNDFETVARRVVAHCGLDWDDACLRFYETDRPVHTASVFQVRQPLYRDAVGRWRPEAETLRPLLDALAGNQQTRS